MCHWFLVSLVVEGRNPGAEETFQSYFTDFDFPHTINTNNAVVEVGDSNKIVTLSVIDLQEQIKKEMSPSKNFLAGSDFTYPNKDSPENGKVIYEYRVTATTSTTIVKFGGFSVAVTVGMEFTTKALGLAENKFKTEIQGSAHWGKDTHEYTADATTHVYRFEFPVPAHCDAVICVMQDELPTRIDWRATFFIEGYVHYKVLVCGSFHEYACKVFQAHCRLL